MSNNVVWGLDTRFLTKEEYDAYCKLRATRIMKVWRKVVDGYDSNKNPIYALNSKGEYLLELDRYISY